MAGPMGTGKAARCAGDTWQCPKAAPREPGVSLLCSSAGTRAPGPGMGKSGGREASGWSAEASAPQRKVTTTSFTLISGSPSNMQGALRAKALGGDTLGLFSPWQPGALVKPGALVRNLGSCIDPQRSEPPSCVRRGDCSGGRGRARARPGLTPSPWQSPMRPGDTCAPFPPVHGGALGPCPTAGAAVSREGAPRGRESYTAAGTRLAPG